MASTSYQDRPSPSLKMEDTWKLKMGMDSNLRAPKFDDFLVHGGLIYILCVSFSLINTNKLGIPFHAHLEKSILERIFEG